MDISSLNVDVLLNLMKFLKSGDRFNLALSGILKGFENVNKGIILHERVEYCGAELGLRRGGMCEWEIRSLVFTRLPDESLFEILERLEGEGYLQNNRKLIVTFEGSRSSRFDQLICSMKNLEKLHLGESELTLEDLAHMFQSCTKITDLNFTIWGFETREVAEHLKNQLLPGFQRLRYFEFECFVENDTWPVVLEMCTWLKECVKFTIFNHNDGGGGVIADFAINDSFKLDPNLARSMKISNLRRVPAALAKWFLSVCLNVHAIQLEFPEPPKSFHNEIVRLEKLKELNIWVDTAAELKEIVRRCRQVEILRMDIYILHLEELAELQPAENMKDISLRWYGGPSIGDVLPIVKRWRHLRRLTFADLYECISAPSVLELGDFIMGMEHLSYLHILPERDGSNDGLLRILREKVNELVLPQRPNFQFDISLTSFPV